MNIENKSSNRSFGILFFFVFLVIALWPLLNSNEIRYWSLTLSLAFLILGVLNSRFLYPFNKLWFKIGLLLGKLISPLIMSFIFFLVVTPIGILMRIFGKDILNIKKNNSKTYWVERKKENNSMKNQF